MRFPYRDTLRPRSPVSPCRCIAVGALFVIYSAPLFWPPGPVMPVTPADAEFLERLFPGVPPLWVVVRLAALAVLVMMLAGASPLITRQLFPLVSADPGPSRVRILRPLALVVAVVHALSAPWAFRLGAIGQNAYFLMLLAPALLLAVPSSFPAQWRPLRARRGFPVAALVLLWTVLRLVGDLGSPRIADVTDSFLGIVDMLPFAAQTKNFLVDAGDPHIRGMGAAVLFFHGLPLFQSGVVPLSVPWVQVFQILWIAASAAGVGILARTLIGPKVSMIAVAVFLFAPYTRFVTENPGQFQVGPIYGTAIVLCAVAACRRRSEAALAALGAIAGIAVLFPPIVPVAALFVVLAAWHLRASWRRLWIGYAAALASFAAVVLPAIPNVYLRHGIPPMYLRLDGALTILEPALMSQLPIGSFDLAKSTAVRRPFDIVAAAVIAPFAHPRTPIRLLGDALFDPIGAALLAIGLAVCLRSALRSSLARLLLLFFGAALCPAFVSPVDRLDIIHALVLPVPAALLAATGFDVLRRQLPKGHGRRWAAAVAAAAICVGGSVLFDVVNPQILWESSFGIMFRVLQPEAADRVVVLNYPKGFHRNVESLYTGPITAFAGDRPVGYLEYGGGDFPRAELEAEGKDLLFWSRGVELDLKISDAVCAQWPGASLFEIWDQAHLGRVYAARVSNRGWEPRGSAGVRRTWDCMAARVPQADG